MADDNNMAIKLNAQALRDIDAYAEYTRIVGDDDGGKTFTPEEYEAYKKRVLPMRVNNRLFVTYTNPDGMDCICVGPETQCFCQHRFKEHKTDFEKLPTTRPIDLPCKVRGCPCNAYQYVPKNGGQFVRCHCKHTSDDHSPASPFLCTNRNCKCNGFKSSFSCDCGFPAYKHLTLVETANERQARGHPIGAPVLYKAMGGLTGFSSLAPGYARQDPSGIGAPDSHILNQPITSDDHPFLRMHADKNDAVEYRRPGESELDFFDRRYKEKEKAKYSGGGRGAIRGAGNSSSRGGGSRPRQI